MKGLFVVSNTLLVNQVIPVLMVKTKQNKTLNS